MALVFSHTEGRWPYVEELTAGFVYLRLHGPDELYASDYDARARERWARCIEAWQQGGQPRDAQTVTGREPPRPGPRDVWVFFDNTDKRHAPANAEALMRRLRRGAAQRTLPRCRDRPARAAGIPRARRTGCARCRPRIPRR